MHAASNLTCQNHPLDCLMSPKTFGDSRGSFCEVYNRKRFFEQGITLEFVQDNQSWSALKGTVRGLHFQGSPMAQDKLIWVPRGRIFDVAIDLRGSSPTCGRWVSEELSAENGRQLLIPVGFAHGFCTLEPVASNDAAQSLNRLAARRRREHGEPDQCRRGGERDLKNGPSTPPPGSSCPGSGRPPASSAACSQLRGPSVAAPGRHACRRIPCATGTAYPSAEGRLVCEAGWVEDRPYGCPYVQTCI